MINLVANNHYTVEGKTWLGAAVMGRHTRLYHHLHTLSSVLVGRFSAKRKKKQKKRAIKFGLLESAWGKTRPCHTNIEVATLKKHKHYRAGGLWRRPLFPWEVPSVIVSQTRLGGVVVQRCCCGAMMMVGLFTFLDVIIHFNNDLTFVAHCPDDDDDDGGEQIWVWEMGFNFRRHLFFFYRPTNVVGRLPSVRAASPGFNRLMIYSFIIES